MTKIRVLVVEDEGIIAMDLKTHLEHFGFNVVGIAYSGQEAVDKAQQTKPDIVLMDVVLRGDMDGVTAAESIRQHFSIPIIYLTAYSDANTLQRAKVTAPYSYLIKPFRPEELRVTIEVALYKYQLERQLQESEQWFSKAFHCISDAVMATDSLGRIKFMNQAAESITNWTVKEAIGKNVEDIISFTDEQKYSSLSKSFIKELSKRVTINLNGTFILSKNKVEIPVDGSVTLVTDDQGNKMGSVLVFRDATQRKREEEQLLFLAKHDHLTGLYNRNQLEDRLNLALLSAKRHSNHVAVIFLDLDSFKLINDQLGHSIGDTLLQAVANRLRRAARANDTLARWGGDEFVVILTDINEVEDVARIAQKIIQAVAQPYVIDKHETVVTPSIGISIYPHDGETAQTLLTHADAAMYLAKQRGKNSYQFYTSDMTVKTLGQLSLEKDLRRALSQNEFRLHYQPLIDLSNGRIVSMEALLRWQHPERGLIKPDEFISLAEEIGLAIPLSHWVLHTAFSYAKEWHKTELSSVRLAVNLSTRQFQQPNLTGALSQILKTTGFNANCLEIELTEQSIMSNLDENISKLKQLHKKGVRLCIDDFGKGYFNLNYLKDFPLYRIKMDSSFIKAIPFDNDRTSIVKAIISMAHNLKLKVAAEGVETEEQLAFLRKQNCNEAQGYFFSEPVIAEKVADNGLVSQVSTIMDNHFIKYSSSEPNIS